MALQPQNIGRIANATGTWQASCSTDVTAWNIANDFILSTYTIAFDSSGSTLKLQWRRAGGTFFDVGSATEIKWSTATSLVNNNSVSNPAGCVSPVAFSEESEGDNTATLSASPGQYNEIQWALGFGSGALYSQEYEFRLVNTSDSITGSTLVLSITTDAAPSVTLQISATDSFVFSESAELTAKPTIQISATDSFAFTQSADLTAKPTIQISADEPFAFSLSGDLDSSSRLEISGSDSFSFSVQADATATQTRKFIEGSDSFVFSTQANASLRFRLQISATDSFSFSTQANLREVLAWLYEISIVNDWEYIATTINDWNYEIDVDEDFDYQINILNDWEYIISVTNDWEYQINILNDFNYNIENLNVWNYIIKMK